jgi:signal transduction histidine kinase
MSPLIGQIFTLLTTLPGNLIYHLVLVFAISGALQGSIQLWRSSNFPQVRRTVQGLGILLGLQLVLFTISGLAWQHLLPASEVLPPLDRAVTLISIVWIAWLWAFPEPGRQADMSSILLTLLTLTLFALTSYFRAHFISVSFNLSLFELIWQGFSLAVVVLGILVLVLRRPNGWGSGLAMLGLALCGHLISLLWRVEGDYPGMVRLMQLASYPILLTLPQRFLSPIARPAVNRTDQPVQQERRRYSTDPKTFHALMSLAAENDTSRLGQALTRGIAHAMLADLCFLVTLNEKNELNVACGYDLIREGSLGGTSIDKESIPMLSNAIQQGRALRLPASSTSSDLKGLGQILGLSDPGHLLSVPITNTERVPVGAILILSPYSNRLWNAEDQTYLSNVANLFIPILERGQVAPAVDGEREQFIKEANELKQKYTQAARELEVLKKKSSQTQTQSARVTSLLAKQEEFQKEIAQLKEENEQLRQTSTSSPAPAPQDSLQLQEELKRSLEEIAHMQNALAESNRRILELEKSPATPLSEKSPATPLSDEQAEVIASISQELRQPMSSIVGYTDLLLGESVGILGSLQRKFVERIKSSTERIGGLIDDMIQLTNLDTGNMQFKPEPIDLNLIIDNAMAYTGSQIREKNITLRLDIPESPAPLQTDRDAFQQILIHLLQNASDCSPSEGTITLRVRLINEEGRDLLSLQVADTGGGIPAEEIPHVFDRRYRADNTLVSGLGDTGVGLAISKTLVEAQNGRIWVDSEAGVGSTFNVLLPVTIEKAEEQ